MKVWNKNDPRVPVDAEYVGRPTKWGNPFVIGKDGTRDMVIAAYRVWLESSGLDVEELRGKDLVCWCAPERCHADVLLILANKAPLDGRN